ncbi:MAG TPA: DUF6635 family protein [Paracoccaceae bacterium]|nr:DUF6635 family protein [Paracoccaceae bacterium]
MMPMHLSRPEAAEIVERAARRYFARRRERVPGFVARHFGFRGSARIHAHAIGWDLGRAPLNVALALPHVLTRLGALLARRAGFGRPAAWLASRQVLRETAVAREIQRLIMTELLELPFEDADGQRHQRDALAEAILADPAVTELLVDAAEAAASRADDPAFRARLTASLTEYAGTRSAAAEITTALFTIGAGAALFHQATPGMIALGPTLAATLAQGAAIASFPLGATLGGVYYGLFPATSSAALLVGTTAALGGLAAVVTTFSGLLADPVQKALGLHERRLLRLIDSLERQFVTETAPGFAAHEHYVARLLDLADVLTGVVRAVKG